MQTKTMLKPHYLHACAVIAAKGDIRFYLNGVYVEIGPQETRYVATDGHKMIILRDQRVKQEPQLPANLIIPIETIDLVPKKFKVPTFGVELHYDTEAAGVECRLGNVFFKPVEGRFPDYNKVVPRSVTGERSTYNPEYLMHFAKAARIALDGRGIPEFWSNGDGVGLVLISNYDDFVGLVMPVRDTSRGDVPAWIKPPEPVVVPPAPEPVGHVEAANVEPQMAAAD